jgi:hypothetical protein
MNALQITSPKTLTIHTTLFDMIAAMQEEATERHIEAHDTDTQIVATVAEWMQSGRVASDQINPILSAA